jgi:hypothetical protein
MKTACLLKTAIVTLLVPLILFALLFDTGCAKKEPKPGYELKTVKSSALNLEPHAQPRFLRRQLDAKARKAQIQIASKQFDVILPTDPSTRECYLIPKDNPDNPPRWWGADQLDATHLVDGKYYRLSISSDNERILVNP